MEYWVVVKESAKRTEESSYEEEHTKRQKAFKFKSDSSTSVLIEKLDIVSTHQIHFWLVLANIISSPSLGIQVDDIPKSDLGDDFTQLEAREKREVAEKDKQSQLPVISKYAQDTKHSILSSLPWRVNLVYRYFVFNIYMYILISSIYIIHCYPGFYFVAAPARPKKPCRNS